MHFQKSSSFLLIDGELQARAEPREPRIRKCGPALVVLVIFVFRRNLRATLIPSLSARLSLVSALAGMYLFGLSLDNLSLMSPTIATGFVVDDAIVMIENIARYLEMGQSPLQAALRGSEEILRPQSGGVIGRESLRALHRPACRHHAADRRDRAAGVLGYFELPVSPLPQVDFPTISVTAQLPGASPEVVATSLAAPLERHLGQIADVTEKAPRRSLLSCISFRSRTFASEGDRATRFTNTRFSATRRRRSTNGRPSCSPLSRRTRPSPI
jgi:hypothetical protein